ncbi:PREDICTED: uncharacterized protein LOC104748380 [Camelina sativa]|uniref:Uncharacterized protein LOC104748380 n=1 Tax=Camelina sativa TaxID=90675 RepID=A0ABM0WAZ0_CAMSA|nr:PREDICTED: uncharacterized protein LOC104748380 [Camelina sativa]
MRRNTQRRKSKKPKQSPAMAATKAPISQQDVVSDDLNYELWARTVKARLVEKGLWAVVENGISPADPSKIPELAAATIQPEDLSKEKEALQILQSSLPDSVLRKTLDSTTTTSAKHLWDSLKEANEEQSKSEGKKEKKFERIIAVDPRLDSNHHYLAITNMAISLSDSYETATEELIVMGLQELTFNNIRRLLDLIESYTMKWTLYEVLKQNEYQASRDCEGFIRWITSMSDSYDGTPLVMKQVVSVKNLTFETTRELIDVFESLPAKTISGIVKGFVVGSTSHVKEVCYSPSDLRCLLKEAKLEMKELGEGTISSAQMKESKQGSATTRVMRSRHERGECIRCGSKGHVFKDCVTFEKDMWMIYDTTTNHMTPHIKYFTTLDRRHRAQIEFITGESVFAEGMGDVRIVTKEGLKKTIKDVLFVPKIDRNVLSVSQLTNAGYIVAMSTDKCIIMEEKNGRSFGQCLWEERGYFLRLQVVEGNLTSTC